MLLTQIPALCWVIIAPLVVIVLWVLCTCCHRDRPQNCYGMLEVMCWSQVACLGCVCNVHLLGGCFHLDLAMPVIVFSQSVLQYQYWYCFCSWCCLHPTASMLFSISPAEQLCSYCCYAFAEMQAGLSLSYCFVLWC